MSGLEFGEGVVTSADLTQTSQWNLGFMARRANFDTMELQ